MNCTQLKLSPNNNKTKRGVSSKSKSAVEYKFYFVKRELFTPACSHFLIIGLRNDIGRAVNNANETTSIKSVVKWFIPKSVPASHNQGNADARKVIGIDPCQLKKTIQEFSIY